MSVPLATAGAYWLGTSFLHWPTSFRFQNRREKFLALSFGVVSVAVLDLAITFVSAAQSYDFFVGECAGPPPLTAPRHPAHSAFIAKIVFADSSKSSDRGHWAIASVERRFWGISSFPRFVLITRYHIESGGTYLIDGIHADGLLTRFFPIVELASCRRTAPLQDAEIDLRVLDRPHDGGRIIGKVYASLEDYRAAVARRLSHSKKYRTAPGTKVAITGPNGTFTVSADDQGIYDVYGLPEGKYFVRIEGDRERERKLMPYDEYWIHMGGEDCWTNLNPYRVVEHSVFRE